MNYNYQNACGAISRCSFDNSFFQQLKLRQIIQKRGKRLKENEGNILTLDNNVLFKGTMHVLLGIFDVLLIVGFKLGLTFFENL